MADFNQVVEEETADTIMTFVSANLKDINTKDAKGLTLLHYAVMKGNLELARQLLDNGADVNIATYEAITPLHFAVDQDEHLVELLLERGADVNCQTMMNFTPLHYAVADRRRHTYHQVRPFPEEASPKLIGRKKRILKLLLNRGARIDQRTCRKWTCLTFAVAIYNQEIVGLLLDYGANPNLKNDFDLFPLHYAVDRQELEVVELLLQHGADVNVKDFLGKTPLLYAIDGIGLQILELLLLHDALVDRQMVWEYMDCSRRVCHSGKKEAIMNILTEHVVKLKQLTDEKSQLEEMELQRTCEVEVNKMKGESIYENCAVSFFDLLTHDMRRIEMYLNNEEGRSQLLQSYFQISFPIYGTMISHRIKLATQRLQLRNETHELLWTILANVVRLPSECTQRILHFFSEAEVKFFRSSHK